MLPLVRQPQTWSPKKENVKSKASSGLPAFTTNLKFGLPLTDRTTTPWRRRPSHGPGSPSKNYVQWPLPHHGDDEDVKVNTKDFDTPNKVYQEKSFRSSTVLRQVPIMRRHLDTFGGRIFSIPVRTKSVPVHTGRFLYDPSTSETFPIKQMTQNDRLEAERDLIRRVRGQKRKREAMEHRWGWRNFDLSGQEAARVQRMSIQAEVEKLKALVLPIEARDIYTGKGIRLPRSHQTKSPIKQLPPDGSGMFPTPLGYHGNNKPTKTSSAFNRTYGQVDAPPTTPKPTNAWEARLQSQSSATQMQNGLFVQSVAVPGYRPTGMTPKPPRTSLSRPLAVETPLEEPQENAPTPMNVPQTLKMQESVEKIEVVKPADGDRDQTKSEMATILETPTDRPRSLAAPSASPEIYAPNPLSPMPTIHQDIISEEIKQELIKQFNEMQSDRQVTFQDMVNISKPALSSNQSNYLQCLYDVTSRKSGFGEQEFMAFSCLGKIIESLSGTASEAFEKINFEVLQESIAQYTELFDSVDRINRGQIGVTALIQILSTTLQRQVNLKGDNMMKQILLDLSKESIDEISKLEFLAHLPYFIQLESFN